SWSGLVISSAGGRPNGFFANNPFLSSAVQTQLMTSTRFLTAAQLNPANAVGGGIPPTPPAGVPYFTAPSYIPQHTVDGMPADRTRSSYVTIGTQRYISAQGGLTGTLMEKFNWDVNFTHGESRLKVRNPNNTDNA